MTTKHDSTFNPFTGSLYTWPSVFNRTLSSFWDAGSLEQLNQTAPEEYRRIAAHMAGQE